jgi:hypothetical protein
MQLEDDDLIINPNFTYVINKILKKNEPDLLITDYIINDNKNIYDYLNNINNNIVLKRIDLDIDNFFDIFNTNFQFGQVIFDSNFLPNLSIYKLGYNNFADEIFILEILKNNTNLKIFKLDYVSYLLNLHDDNFASNSKNKEIEVYSLFLYISYLLNNFNYQDIKKIMFGHLENLNLKNINLDKFLKIKENIYRINKEFLKNIRNNINSWDENKEALINNLKSISYLWS